ncbi:PQQ-binding-like beta-propeller repeat protein [Actinoplanes sp. NEAU-A12]|uniref:PQQ-binding-like beta-propeller repeat protein n=1 Tax=Actinoplanes sandaracinus TaxID=3045177 RepID=A0ABT6WVT7_9ACTN|nr:PQQ-binding-like beta-propeller repeat protein [Actinoplanes sandaracinus]MDI6103858.1 PQQ-binding-like beta-propeller repeat protein [Actinoplanes sandaracinus]
MTPALTDSMRHAPGVSEAAAPTPATAPRSSPVDVQYADPVDPWATAEAAAIAAGGHPGGYTPHPDGTWTVPEPGRKRIRTYLLAGGAAAVVVAIVAAAAVIFWPGHPALDYHPLKQVERITPLVPISSTFADTEVLGERAYFASVNDTGRLHVVAADTGDGRVFWESDQAGQATSWKSMYALPSALVLISGTDSATSTSRVVVLDAIYDGKVLWEKRLGANDDIYLSSKIMVWVNREADKLIGLGTADGLEKWSLDDPDASTIHLITTPDDLNGPAGDNGRIFAPDTDDDQRFVQIDSDRTATVRDLNTGNALRKRPGVAGTSDKVVAHDGRLYVLEPGTTKRIFSYDLGSLESSQPVTLHTASSTEDIKSLTPCGKLLCFVLTKGYDRKTDVIMAVGEEPWQKPQPEVEALVPVGDNGLLAVGDEGTALLVDGKEAWYNLGVAVRLDAGNVLRFSRGLSSSVDDRGLSGAHVGEKPVDLGVLEDVRSETCSWSTSAVTCATETEYVIYSFAG